MSVTQLSFVFTYSVDPKSESRPHVSWRVSTLAKRYRIPVSQALLYAAQMGLPIEDPRR